MKLELRRIARRETYTIGRLYIDGVYFCDTLEDRDRLLDNSMSVEEIKKKKIYGKTAIPTGTYKVEITYSPRFKRYLPLICNVKGFDGIRIHEGNSDKDSQGCVLVGINDKVGWVSKSRITMNKLLQKIKGKELTIKIC